MNTDNFSMKDLRRVRELIKTCQLERTCSYCVRADFVNRLRAEIPRRTSAETDFGRLEIYEMPNQKAACWLIEDPGILKAYLSGDMSETDLERLAGEQLLRGGT